MSDWPNLFIIGAMKSGTTYLHRLLAGHPDIAMCEPKEPCFFIDPTELRRRWPQMARTGYAGDGGRYRALFSEAGDARYRGESTTLYALAPLLSGVPERIAAVTRRPALIYVMRDPVERTLSHIWHDTRVMRATPDLLGALPPNSEYLLASHYAFQLGRYAAVFGLERLYCLTFEELVASPQETVARLLRWLDLEPLPIDATRLAPENVAPEQARTLRFGGEPLYRASQSAPWQAIAGRLPWRLRRVFVTLLERPLRRDELDLDAVKDRLRDLQRPQVEELSVLLGRPFPEWTTLFAESAGRNAASDG